MIGVCHHAQFSSGFSFEGAPYQLSVTCVSFSIKWASEVHVILLCAHLKRERDLLWVPVSQIRQSWWSDLPAGGLDSVSYLLDRGDGPSASGKSLVMSDCSPALAAKELKIKKEGAWGFIWEVHAYRNLSAISHNYPVRNAVISYAYTFP